MTARRWRAGSRTGCWFKVCGSSAKVSIGARLARPCTPCEVDQPSMTSAITAAHTEAALAKIRSGRWRANEQGNSWVGHAIAEVLGLDVGEAGGKAKVKAALNMWIVSGRLRVVTAKDENSRFKHFVEVAPGSQAR